MTTCTVFGKKETSTEKKPIKFIKYLDDELNFGHKCSRVEAWGHLVYLCKYGKYDCMYAYNEGEENEGTIYFGHWNDGVVE